MEKDYSHYTENQIEAIKRQEAPFWSDDDKVKMTDEECILICLRNAPCGTDKNQVNRLIAQYGGIVL